MCSPNFLSFSINKAKVKFAKNKHSLDLSLLWITSIVYEDNDSKFINQD